MGIMAVVITTYWKIFREFILIDFELRVIFRHATNPDYINQLCFRILGNDCRPLATIVFKLLE